MGEGDAQVGVLKRVYSFLVTVYFKFLQDNGFLLAAGIAFFTFLSIFPLLLALGVVLGYFLENPALRDQILSYVFQSFPALSGVVQSTIESFIRAKGSAGLIALVGLLWAGTGLYGGLAGAINAVYGVKETRNVVIQRLMGLFVFIVIMALLLVSFGATSIASILRDRVLRDFLPPQIVTFTGSFFSYAIGFISTFLLFLVIYRLVPNVKLKVRSVLPGAVVACVAWQLIELVLAFYLKVFASRGYGFVYGSLAAIVISMFWLNISSILLLLGAEINVVYVKQKKGGVKIFEPRKGQR